MSEKAEPQEFKIDANAVIQTLLAEMSVDQADMLASGSPGYKKVAEAVMAWYRLLMSTGIIKKTPKTKEILAASMLVMGTIVKYSFALGWKLGLKSRER